MTKLGIYSTYSPRSTIHFLARCSNFCKPLRKKSESCSSKQVFAAAMISASEEKRRSFKFFSAQGTGGSPKGHDPENWCVIKTMEAKIGQFLLGCKCPVRRGIVVQEQDPLGDLPAAFFLQNVLQLHQPAEMSNTPR